MTNPIVFISRNRIKPGMLDDFTNHYLKSIPRVEANKPGTLVQIAYLNADSTQVDIVRIFPGTEAMDQQLQGADDRSKVTYQYIEPTGIEIYGAPSDGAMAKMKKVAGSRIEVSIIPHFMGGFIRLNGG